MPREQMREKKYVFRDHPRDGVAIVYVTRALFIALIVTGLFTRLN